MTEAQHPTPARRRRFFALNDLALRWAAEAGWSDYDAATRIVEVLDRHRSCLTVECDKLSEIRHGVAAEVMDERRARYVDEIREIVNRRNGLDSLARYAIKGDCFAAALHKEGIESPSCLPQPAAGDEQAATG